MHKVVEKIQDVIKHVYKTTSMYVHRTKSMYVQRDTLAGGLHTLFSKGAIESVVPMTERVLAKVV